MNFILVAVVVCLVVGTIGEFIINPILDRRARRPKQNPNPHERN